MTLSYTGRSNGGDKYFPSRAYSGALLFRGKRLKAPGRTQHDNRLLVLVFRRSLHLITRESQRNEITLAVSKVQRVPVDRDLAAADAKKAAEIDNSGSYAPLTVDQDVDDAPHVLIGTASHLLAEDALRLPRPENGYRRFARFWGSRRLF